MDAPGAKYEGLFEALLRQSVDGIILTELPSRRTLDVSNSMCVLTGYSREEIIGGLVGDRGLVNRDSIRAPTQRTMAGLRGMYEVQIRCKDGQQRWVEVSTQPLGTNLILSILRDVSERWSVEDALRRRADELSARLEALEGAGQARESSAAEIITPTDAAPGPWLS